MVNAIEVAKYLLYLALQEPECCPGGLSQKQLQKLLYYVQGYSLGRRDCPVFFEEVRAWREGPVVREVYDVFKGGTSLDKIPVVIDDFEIDPLEQAFIASVWEDLKGCSERDLIERSHAETPWCEARRRYRLRPHEPSDVPMTHRSLREFFSQPSPAAMSKPQLEAIASDPKNAPPESWLEEPDPFSFS